MRLVFTLMSASLLLGIALTFEGTVVVFPHGPEFDVLPGDTSTGPRLVSDENGDYLALFFGQFGGTIALRGGHGSTLEPTFLVGPGSRGSDVDTTAPGEFVVSWSQMPGYGGRGPAYEDVMMQRFAKDGTALSTATAVGDLPTNTIAGRTAVGSRGADYWVVWEHHVALEVSLRARLIPEVNPPAASIQLNTWTTGSQYAPRMAVSPSGEAFVVWRSTECAPADPDQGCVRGRLFDSLGSPSPTDFQVNSYTTGLQGLPIIAAHSTGFLATWPSDDCGDTCIRGRRFDLTGSPSASEIRIDQAGSDSVGAPDLDANSDGSFVASWTRTEGGTTLAYARAFDAADQPLTDEFQVNSSTTSEPYSTAIARNGDDGFVVVWSDGYSMWGRSFALMVSLFADGFESGDTSAWSADQP